MNVVALLLVGASAGVASAAAGVAASAGEEAGEPDGPDGEGGDERSLLGDGEAPSVLLLVGAFDGESVDDDDDGELAGVSPSLFFGEAAGVSLLPFLDGAGAGVWLLFFGGEALGVSPSFGGDALGEELLGGEALGELDGEDAFGDSAA